jgi:HK97 family phage major capsid protein
MALTEAQRLAKQMREEPDKTAELQVAFDKAHAEFVRETQGLRMLDIEKELEAQAKALRTPDPARRIVTRAGESDPAELPSVTQFNHRARRVVRATYGRWATDPVLREAHAEAFDSFLRLKDPQSREAVETLTKAGAGPEEIHMLLGTQGDLGGFLIPEDFRNEVVRDLAGFAVMRNLCRVIPTSSNVLVLPSIQSGTDPYSSGYQGSWKAEGYVSGGTAPTVQNQPRFGQERIPIHGWQPDAIELSQELLADSGAPLDSILAEIIAETRALDEDAAFLNGNGVNRPMGLMADTRIATVNSGASGNLTYNGIVDLFATLPAQYRQSAKWLMASLTFAQVLKLADTQARPILTPNEIPGNLWGKPMVFSEFMPQPAAAALAMAFGDFRYYCIADRQELRIQRLIERFAPNIGILPTARLGGQVLRPNAFKFGKQSV